MSEKEELILNFMKDKDYVPMKAKEIALVLNISKDRYNELLEILDKLEKDLKIKKNKKNRYRINDEKILEGILDFKLTEKRMEMFTNDKGILVINDCYNANYDSMKAAIEYLAKLPNKRKIAILGDMLELGEYSKQLHEKVGEEINKNKIDVLITVGEEAKNISKIAQKTVKEIYNFEKNEQAIKLLQTYLQKEDAVLIKASNGMNFTEISAQLETVPN